MTDAAHTEADTADAGAPLQAMLDHLLQLLGNALIDGRVTKDQIVIKFPVTTVTDTLTSLRDDNYAAFNQLSDLTAVDYPERPDRFEMVYQAAVDEKQHADACSCLGWRGAGRAVHDDVRLFGRELGRARGLGHVRDLLCRPSGPAAPSTDYGFEGHPLRKDSR